MCRWCGGITAALLRDALERFGGRADWKAPLVHSCGPDRSLHGDCAKRVQLGGAGRTERMPGVSTQRTPIT